MLEFQIRAKYDKVIKKEVVKETLKRVWSRFRFNRVCYAKKAEQASYWANKGVEAEKDSEPEWV